MSTDNSEAMRPNMNDRSEREFMSRMESNHAKLTEFSRTVESFTHDYQRLYATYTSYREMLREVIAERDQLREELAEQAAIYGAATHIHSELRSIVQAGGSDEAIGREFRKRALSEIADAFASLRGEVESLRAVSDEYNHWVRFHAAGDGDYDDFIVTHCRHDAARTTHKETE